MLKLIVPFLGKTKERYLAAGIEDFSSRLRRFVQLELPVLKEKKNIARDDLARQKQEEGRALLAALPAGARLVALDSTGRQPESEELARMLGDWDDQGVREAAFLIGGPDGLADEIIARADYVLSLSRLTFTHELARLLLLEQLYRAFSIRAGTGYHR